MELTGIRKEVFLDRYSLKNEKGEPTEHTPDQMWSRVAKYVASAEKTKKNKETWMKIFYDAMQNFQYVPGGRILSGAGTGYNISFYNCFVIPSPHDSRDGILETLKRMVEIMALGGGVGINLSSLRPRGSRVRKVNGFSSGPCNWGELFSVACKDIIQQGGTRRGALMIMLHDWHPDVEEFITVKQDLARINGANLSVCISDSFMEAVEADEEWPLVFPDTRDPKYDGKWNGDIEEWKKLGGKIKVRKLVSARKIWDLIGTAAWKSAEPGVVFMERYNKLNNNWYWNRINCVNPCVTGDTLVATEVGWIPAEELKAGIKIATPNGLKPIKKVHRNGIKRIYKVTFSDGGTLKATADHKLKVVRGKRYHWIEITKLKIGDKVVVADQTYFQREKKLTISDEVRQYAEANGIVLKEGSDREIGFIIGVAIGDGCFSHSGKKYGYTLRLSVGRKETEWKKILQDRLAQFGVSPGLQRYEYQVLKADGNKVVHGSRRLTLGKFAAMLGLLGLESRAGSDKTIPEVFLNLGIEFQKGLLDGLFSTGGSVSLKSYDPLLRLTSSSKKLLQQTRLLLFNFGIHARIYEQKRKKTVYNGQEITGTRVKYELLIMNGGIVKFWKQIGFSHPDKQKKLKKIADEYHFMSCTNFARVKKIEDTGKSEEVYDVYEPETLTWVTNGYVSLDCGEEGLPPWGVCNLGSINLSSLVAGADDPDDLGKFDYARLKKLVRTAIRFQDNLIDLDPYVFKEIRNMQQNGERRIGLGTMGLGDCLIKMHLRYGSEESLSVIERIYKTIRDEAYKASVEIAREKGTFPRFDKRLYLKGKFIKKLPQSIRRDIKKHGIRNSLLLMQAPTGTTSLLSDTTSGIEPVYEFEFIRKDRLGKHILRHNIYEKWYQKHKEEVEKGTIQRPVWFVSTNDLLPEEHIKVQAAVQKYVDASISKTVNAPETHTVEDVKKLYTLAYKLGLKGIAYMRDGSRPGVLAREDDKKEHASNGQATALLPKKKKRPVVVQGSTYLVQTPVGKAYVTINTNGGNEPLEVFINVGKGGSDIASMAEALGRMISLNLRFNSHLSPNERIQEIISECSGIGGSRSIGFGKDRVRSLPDAVAKVLVTHFANETRQERTIDSVSEYTDEHAEVDGQQPGTKKAEERKKPIAAQLHLSENRTFDICPECGVLALAYEEGCKKCYSCGYSEC